jgi:hypothetical protein
VISLFNEAYEKALSVFEAAVASFSSGDLDSGNRLLASLDQSAIEDDRQQLLQLARGARDVERDVLSERFPRTISRALKDAVSRRDRYHCRFTARRLIDTRVFREISRVSSQFHFDEHHSVAATRRGPGGHPIVRTHGAAYEHLYAHAHGGETTLDNLVLTCVQLNEAKGTRSLELVDVPNRVWDGLLEFLPILVRLPTARKHGVPSELSLRKSVTSPPSSSRAMARHVSSVARLRQTAALAGVEVYALENDPTAERAFLRLRKTDPNSFFATKRANGIWMVHRVYCSSLDFSVSRELTRSPKVCSISSAKLEKWATLFDVRTEVCSRCRRAR